MHSAHEDGHQPRQGPTAITTALVLNMLWIGWMTYRVAQPPSPLEFNYHILSADQKIDRVAHESVVMVAAFVSLGLLADYAWAERTPRR